MLKLKLQYISHLMWRADSLGKTLMLGKIVGKRRKGQPRMGCLNSITDSMDMNLRNFRRLWRTEETGVVQSMGWQRVGHDLVTEQQQYNSYIQTRGHTLRIPWMIFHRIWHSGEGSLMCCSPWAHKESDTTEWLIWCHNALYLFNWSSFSSW